MSRVSVVIPNWNGAKFLGVCLSSLHSQSFEDFETILVDNGSTDGSVEFVKSNFPEVRVYALEDNHGFSVAANAGIEASGTEYVALLNNDTETVPGWLEALVRSAEAHPEAGLFASKLVDFHNRRFLDGAGDAIRLSGLPYRLGHGERDRGQFDEISYVFGACAAAAMYRRKMLDEIGFFDEDFVSYCEDGDVSFRAQLADYHCLYVPDAVVYHMGSASTGGKRSATATRLGTRNSLSLLVKNLPLSVVPHVLPFFVLGQLARLLTAAATGTLRPHLKGLAEAWDQLPLTLKKRREIQSRKKVSDARVRRLLRGSSLAATRSIACRLRDRVQTRLGS
ncbi:MAG TPA: glycosyltransferase family 2 protein [Rubrobacteraceae bacterium]|nr:glycosyltransferase family 2 protein [Rubrobacteraceae bacterium]